MRCQSWSELESAICSMKLSMAWLVIGFIYAANLNLIFFCSVFPNSPLPPTLAKPELWKTQFRGSWPVSAAALRWYLALIAITLEVWLAMGRTGLSTTSAMSLPTRRSHSFLILHAPPEHILSAGQNSASSICQKAQTWSREPRVKGGVYSLPDE